MVNKNGEWEHADVSGYYGGNGHNSNGLPTHIVVWTYETNDDDEMLYMILHHQPKMGGGFMVCPVSNGNFEIKQPIKAWTTR